MQIVSFSLVLLFVFCSFACQVKNDFVPGQSIQNNVSAPAIALLPVSKGDTIAKILPISKGDTIGSTSIVSRDLPQSLTQIKGSMDLPFEGKQVNITVQDFDNQRTLAELLTNADGSFAVDGASVGLWLSVLAEAKVADSDKKVVFAAVIDPQQPLSEFQISLESTAFAAVLTRLQSQKASLLRQSDLATITEQVAPLTSYVLTEMQAAPGQPLLNYVNTPTFEAQLKTWQETTTHE